MQNATYTKCTLIKFVNPLKLNVENHVILTFIYLVDILEHFLRTRLQHLRKQYFLSKDSETTHKIRQTQHKSYQDFICHPQNSIFLLLFLAVAKL